MTTGSACHRTMAILLSLMILGACSSSDGDRVVAGTNDAKEAVSYEDGGCIASDYPGHEPERENPQAFGRPDDPKFGIPRERQASGPPPARQIEPIEGEYAVALEIARSSAELKDLLSAPIAESRAGTRRHDGVQYRTYSLILIFEEPQEVSSSLPEIITDGPDQEAGPVTTIMAADGVPASQVPSRHALEVRRSTRSLEIYVDVRDRVVLGVSAWSEDLRYGC